jgi:hypothetical protein
VLVAAAVGVFGASAAPPAQSDASAVTAWNSFAVTTLVNLPGPAGGAPPTSQINMGMVQGAVYDAVNAITPKHHRPYLLTRRFGNTASDDAAVATAAYFMLKNIVTTIPSGITPEAKATVLASIESRYAAATNAIPDSPFKNMGIAAGTAAAQAMIDARLNDGRFGASQYTANSNPGYWDPIAPNGATAQDPTAWAGGVKPFLMQSSSQFRSAGPNALTSAKYAAELAEVRALGGVTSSTRTDRQTYIARWWQSNPVASWNDVARQLITRDNLSAPDAARLLAMENLAAADAAINTWNDKYHFSFWRPFQAIRRAATNPDTTWTPLLSAPYPEHTSGHLGVDASHTTVLKMFFGNTPGGGAYQITSGFVNPGVPGCSATDCPATRSFTSFSQAVDEIIEARIWAGLHFRTADEQAVQLASSVANYAAANYFQPVGNH